MRRILHTISLCFIMAVSLWFAAVTEVSAAGQYEIILEDDADLLTDAQEQELRVTMEGAAQHGNMVFKTIIVNAKTSEKYAQDFYVNRFGEEDGVIFLIDMDNRNLWLCCYGKAERMIPDDYTEIITDNVYTYASDGEYFECANIAFSQIQTRLEGGRISQPMKYVCNALFALSLALFINFFVMRSMSSIKAPKERQRQKGIRQRFALTNPQAVLQETKRVYSPVESSSSGGSSSGSSGGSSGGSSSGGSSGGHSF